MMINLRYRRLAAPPILALVLLAAASAAAWTGALAQGTPPNIVLISTDDMNTSEIDFMPAVGSLLVQKGITFSNAFVTTPNCCPSRASFLRSQYAHNHGILVNAPGWNLFFALGHESSTVGTWMQRLNYRTGLVGKYLNEYGRADPSHVPVGWDDWIALVGGQGYYGYTLNENAVVVEYGNAPEDYQTDVIAGHAVAFIGRAVADPRPFFLYVAPAAPHTPFIPARRHADAFPEVTQAPRPPSFNEADVSDKPAWIREHPLMDEATIARIDADYRARLQMLLAVDEMVASIVGELERLGLLANTYVIFTSDNGWQQGEHRLDLGKRQPYEESIRVPLVVRGPGVPAAVTRDQFVLNIDLGPTFIFLASGRVPPFADGRSVAGLLTDNPPANWRSRFLVEHAGDFKGPGFNAVRTRDHLYAERFETGEIELYQLAADPHQLQSIHDTAPASLLEQLASELARLVTCAGASCRSADR